MLRGKEPERISECLRKLERLHSVLLKYSCLAIMSKLYLSSSHSEKVDIWSAGTVLYMMLSGQMPFDDPSVPQLIAKITHGDYTLAPLKVSLEAKDLILQMLTLDPTKRLSATDVLKHSWFKIDFTNANTVLKQVTADFNDRRSKKLEGRLNVSQVLKVENINEEILKSGLEIGHVCST